MITEKYLESVANRVHGSFAHLSDKDRQLLLIVIQQELIWFAVSTANPNKAKIIEKIKLYHETMKRYFPEYDFESPDNIDT